MVSFHFTIMPDVNIWLLVGAGLIAGFLGSMLGLGGGFLMVPIITLGSSIPIQFAIGSSLVSIVVNACTATSVYINHHMTNLKLGLLLSTMLIPGAAAGAYLAAILPAEALMIAFGILLLYIAWSMVPRRKKPLSPEEIEAQNTKFEKSHAPHAWLDDSYYDPALGREVKYQVHRPITGMVTSFFGGALSSLLGIGGGIVNVPVMHGLMKIPDKATIATSSILLAFTTMTGALIYAHNGYIVPYLVAPLCIGVYIGARLGAALTRRVKGSVLFIVLSVFLALTAVSMVLKGLSFLGG